jgi:hypothetical protein
MCRKKYLGVVCVLTNILHMILYCSAQKVRSKITGFVSVSVGGWDLWWTEKTRARCSTVGVIWQRVVSIITNHQSHTLRVRWGIRPQYLSVKDSMVCGCRQMEWPIIHWDWDWERGGASSPNISEGENEVVGWWGCNWKNEVDGVTHHTCDILGRRWGWWLDR